MKTKLLTLSPAEFCEKTNACQDGAAFAASCKSMHDVWEKCPSADWLLWIVSAIKAPKDEKNLRLFSVWCARNTPLLDGRKTGGLLTDPRSIAALEVAELFANGKATREELDAAWAAAWDAQAKQFRKMFANPFPA